MPLLIALCDICQFVVSKEAELFEEPWHNELFGDGEFTGKVSQNEKKFVLLGIRRPHKKVWNVFEGACNIHFLRLSSSTTTY